MIFKLLFIIITVNYYSYLTANRYLDTPRLDRSQKSDSIVVLNEYLNAN